MSDSGIPEVVVAPRWLTFVQWIRSRWLLVLSALAAGLAVLAYVSEFAPGSHSRFSQDPLDWAHLGDYLGGMFGALAFVGVLITINQQYKQLSQIRNQATIDELHRLCREISAIIEAILDRPLFAETGANEVQIRTFAAATTRSILESAVVLDLYSEGEGRADDKLNSYRNVIVLPARLVVRELNTLQNILLDLFAWNGGKSVIFDYYRDRYQEVARGLQVLRFEVQSPTFWTQ